MIAIASVLSASESLAGAGTGNAPAAAPAETAADTSATFAGWLERVARAYQDEIAIKLSTARAGAASVESSERPPASAGSV
jgi:hypothetical protein